MKTKVCTKCKKEKPLDEFPNNKNAKEGNHWWCKKCNDKNTYNWSKEYYKENPWVKHYNNIKQRCNNPNNPNWKWWGAKGIRCLITKEELKELWFRDKAYEMEYPTIDRIDNSGNYEYNNCQFLENIENSTKDSFGHKTKNGYVYYYQIGQYTKQEKLIKIWNSQREIARELNVSQADISTCVNGKSKKGYQLKTVKGFVWKKLDKIKDNTK